MSNVTQPVKTMSSLELVEVINELREEGKAELRHDNFMVKIEKHPGIDAPRFLGTQKYGNGNTRNVYNLPKRECELMVMSESLAVQTRVYDRMTELEAKPTAPILTWPAGEEATRVANAISDCLRLDGTSRAAMLRSILQDKAPEYVRYLPAYATNAPRTMDGKLVGAEGNSLASYAATALLKKVGASISVQAFNKLAEAHGFVETQERPSTKHENMQRTFKSVSAKGLAYGRNVSHENAKGATQVVWFESKFKELLGILGVSI